MKNNFAINYVKKTAPSQTQRVFPFNNDPLAIFKNVFNNASHISLSKLKLEHSLYIRFTNNRLIRNLMIDSIIGIQVRDFQGIRIVKSLYPL